MASLAIVGGYVCTGPKVSWNNRGDRIKCSYITATDRIVSTKKLDHPLLIKTRNFFILLKVSGIQGFRDSGIQGFKDSRIQGFKDSRVQGSKWCLILDTGCWMLDAGCWRDTRCRIQDTGCRQPGKLANRQTGPRANGPTGKRTDGPTGKRRNHADRRLWHKHRLGGYEPVFIYSRFLYERIDLSR
ncbi:hypothetical protein D3OALGB2SA_4360 [Olavius algarvensis associated proteobacterium Delta 3]|nr:hypothetical protein D3OALGB2SA_4360 [Olavius algarvensis associated proteobacterium Delta 3]